MAIIIAAFNLRPAITSVGPLVSLIRDDIGLSNLGTGAITSLPLLAFAIISPISSYISNKTSNDLSLFAGLIILSFGLFVRFFNSVIFLYLGTFLIGVGIGICNVILPAVIKEKFPNQTGTMTGVYSVAMGGMASIASALSVPIAINFDLGWKIALLIWVIPVLIGIGIWGYVNFTIKNASKKIRVDKIDKKSSVWTSFLSWQIAIFMGLQSFVFYVTIAWLPEILYDYGVSITSGGTMLSFMQLIGLPVSFIVPYLAGRFQTQKALVGGLVLCGILGYCGLLIGHTYIIMVLSIIFIGISMGGVFPLALTFLSLKARNVKQSSNLSGMAQSIGYLLAMLGPIFIGFLYDLSSDWMLPILTIIIIELILIILGFFVGRDIQI